jgi:curved DNA-binding protein CbpA
MFNNKEKEQKATEDLKTNVYNNQARPHYLTLGLPVGANMEQVKDQYKKLVKQHHPDRQTDPTKQKAALEMTQKLNIAYSFFKENPPKN